jgi:NAD+ synthetase
VLVGCLERRTGGIGRRLCNAVALCSGGEAKVVARKSLLPTYDIFDEARYFEPWERAADNVVAIGGVRFGVSICEDAWNDREFFAERLYRRDPIEELVRAGAEVLINISASPWGRQRGESRGKDAFRAEMLQAAARRHGRRIVFVNQVGANVGAQFDGGSTGFAPEGGVAVEPVWFAPAVHVVDTRAAWRVTPVHCDLRDMQHRAIVQGIGGYAAKFGFERAVVGLSGGIDSALTALLAVDALGPAAVTGVAMPSTFSSPHSMEDARALADRLGIELAVVPIEGLQRAYDDALREMFTATAPGIAEENLQARARGAVLMAHSNKFGSLLLTTGNKSEVSVGYCTLYGDMCGSLAPIADLWKTEVWELARWVNRAGERIPQRSIEKPPSAELRPGQLDTDSLPPYAELDPVLRMLVEEERPVGEVSELSGMARERVAEIFRKVQRAEFKRVQYCPTVRVSERCWDGRRVPASHRHVSE